MPRSRALNPAAMRGAALVLAAVSLGVSVAPRAACAADGAMVPGRAAEVERLLSSARMWDDKYRADLALQFVGKALLLAPGDPQVLLQKGLIEVRAGQFAAATKTLRELRAAAPGARATLDLEDAYRFATRDKHAFPRLRTLVRTGKPDQAVQQLRELFPRGEPAGNLALEYYRILAAYPATRAEAVTGLRAWLRRTPEDSDAALALAGMLVDTSATRREGIALARQVALQGGTRRQRALDLWRGALFSTGDDPAYLSDYADYLAQVPDDKNAAARITALQEIRAARARLEADPAWRAARRGSVLLARNDLAAAEPLLEQAMATRGNDPQLLGSLGLLRMRQGRHDEARRFFERAAALDAEARAKWQDLARTAAFWDTVARSRAAATAGHPAQAEQLAREALRMQPRNRDAQALLLDALLAQANWQAAEPLLRKRMEAPQPDLQTIEQTDTLLRATGRAAELAPLYAALEQRFTGETQVQLQHLHASRLSAEADALIAQHEDSAALARLEQAVQLAPEAPWTRYTLAGVYRRLGLPQLGRAVMDQGLEARTPAAPEMRYAVALYRNALDDFDGAAAVLEPIPEAARTAGMRALGRQAEAQQLLARAAVQRQQGGPDGPAASVAALRRAAELASDTPQMLATIGTVYIDQGEADTGLGLVRGWLDMHPGHPDTPERIDVRLRYGDLLARAGRDDALASWLAPLAADPALDPAQRARLADQSLRLALRRTDAALESPAADRFERAEAILRRVDAAGQADPRWSLEMADLRRAQGRYDDARAALVPLLARAPDDATARLALARVLEDSGDRQQARALVEDVLAAAPADDVETRLSAARRLVALRRPAQAAAVTQALRERYPERADITVQAGRAAQAAGRLDDAAALYTLARTQERATAIALPLENTPAQRALDDLDALHQGQLATAWLPSYKSGDAGVSRSTVNEVPLYLRLRDGYRGNWFFHADSVSVAAGTLDFSNVGLRNSFGTFAAAPDVTQDTLRARLDQHAFGVALAAGYEADAWRADVGTTPLGFPVQDVVGGLRYAIETDYANFTANVSRRADTSTLISYAGVRDPVTGAVWGGVRRNGIDLHAGKQAGKFGFFLDVGAGVLTGHDVPTNTEETLRTGFDYLLLSRPDMRVRTGLTGSAWHYDQNLRYYTFGQGGYYSPQRYLSLSVPLQWEGRYRTLSWQLEGSIGRSSTYESDTAFFPTDAGLQARAVAAGIDAVHHGGAGGGLSYALGGTVEWRATPHLIAGALFSIDRSHDYAPTRAMVYARYMFDAQKGSVPFPPSPVRPYSRY